ncbi:MAG: CDP-alcohol phosphatidyltransferase family protein [Gammaproteobacteria bacterium]
MSLLNTPNCLSLSRVLMAPLTAWLLHEGLALLSVVAFMLVILSDVLDGRVARARAQVSVLGTLLDHGADAVFVSVMLATAAVLGLIPGALPMLIVVAFVQYALDGGAPVGAAPRGSQLGRINGIAYYVMVACIMAVHHFFPVGLFADGVRALAWVLVMTTSLSILSRAAYVWRVRRQA